MKSIIHFVVEFFDGFARAKAATHFTRMGRPDLARDIMLKD